jgi:hypothetical protein
VPCHINIKDGNIALTSNDHTLLGLRASTYLMPYLPEKYRLLPLLQSVWYIGPGLDIWNQLLFRYPGRYATMKGVRWHKRTWGGPYFDISATPLYCVRRNAYTSIAIPRMAMTQASKRAPNGPA